MAEKRWFWDETKDNLLRSMYDPHVRGRSRMIASRLKMPRWAVNRRAVALGMSRPKDKPWTSDEEEYLETNYHRIAVKTMARRLERSVTAIKLKAKRLGLRKHDEGYTACSLAEALGVDPHWVLAKIRSGKLRASHRRTDRTPEQGGDSWFITDEAVLDFLREHPYDIDLRKVDSLWFMDLIALRLQGSGTRPVGTEVA